MKERIKGVFTKKKIFHFLKMALFVVALSLILLSLLGTVAHATGLVDDTINAENLYSKYPLSNYQLDFYVDNSWSWLPWNWLDGIGKSVQYGLYCITNFSRSFFADSSYMLSFSVLCSCVCSRLISPSVSSWHKQDNTLMHQSPGHIQRRTPYNF